MTRRPESGKSTLKRSPNHATLDVVADLEPIEQAIGLLKDRWPGAFAAAALASPTDAPSLGDEDQVALMNEQRRLEFIGGRMAATQALRDAGHPHPAIAVDAHGVPVFPDGYVGSIAHKHGRAVAIVARPNASGGIGIDLEFDENHDEESLCAEVLTEPEQQRYRDLQTAEPGLLSVATLVLAAKEAVYKAAFPIVRTEFYFDDVELLFTASTRAFRAVRFPGSEQVAVRGSYELGGRWIVTVASATLKD